ncbi:MAG: hypothetical protein ACXWP1_11545, partial [Bdellovibrionota bacterium]
MDALGRRQLEVAGSLWSKRQKHRYSASSHIVFCEEQSRQAENQVRKSEAADPTMTLSHRALLL